MAWNSHETSWLCDFFTCYCSWCLHSYVEQSKHCYCVRYREELLFTFYIFVLLLSSQVFLGVTNRDNLTDGRAELYNGYEYSSHPEYDEKAGKNNVALIKLDRKINFVNRKQYHSICIQCALTRGWLVGGVVIKRNYWNWPFKKFLINGLLSGNRTSFFIFFSINIVVFMS